MTPEWLDLAQALADNFRRMGDPNHAEEALFLLESEALNGQWPPEVLRQSQALAEEIRQGLEVGPEADRAAKLAAQLFQAQLDDPAVARRLSELRTHVSPERARALAVLPEGPYSVVFHGVAKGNVDEDGLRCVLCDLGYSGTDANRVVQHVIHIAPETVAYLLEDAAAIEIKVRLERAGGKVRIK